MTCILHSVMFPSLLRYYDAVRLPAGLCGNNCREPSGVYFRLVSVLLLISFSSRFSHVPFQSLCQSHAVSVTVGMQPVNQVIRCTHRQCAQAPGFASPIMRFVTLTTVYFRSSLWQVTAKLLWLFPNRSLPQLYSRSSVRCFDSPACTALPMVQTN